MLIVVVICVITLTGCRKDIENEMPPYEVPPTPGYTQTDKYEWWLDSVTAFELWSNTPGAFIIDVRSEESFLDRHVSGAVNVQADGLPAFANDNITDKNTLIITYCFCGGMGGPALTARNLLTDLGYTNVWYTDPEDEWEFGGNIIIASTIITGAEAKELYLNDETAILLDVRNPDEFEEFHIEGSLLIPVAELDARLDELPNDKNTIIIVFCRAGRRSAAAAVILTENGYTKVYDMQMVTNWPQ